MVALTASASFVIMNTLGGCATMSSSVQQSRIGKDDGTDACYPLLRTFDATHAHWAERIVENTFAGAALGAATGFLVSGGSMEGAKQGAIGGAVAGAASGAAQAQADQAAAKADVYSKISSQYDQELAQVDGSALAFKQLVDCRNAQLRTIVNDYKAKAIDGETAKARWKSVLALKARDLKIASQEGTDMSNHISEFEKHSTDQLSGYSNVQWDAATEKHFQEEQAALEARQAQEQAALKAEYDAKRRQDRAEREKAKAEYERKKKEQDARHQQEMTALQQKKAGQIPTSTAQTHLQSYNSAVVAQQQSYSSQVATAENPDGFEASINGAS